MTAIPLESTGEYGDVDFLNFIVVQSKDGPEFKMTRKAAAMSGLLKDMLEESTEGERTVIPIPEVEARVLGYVIEYCTYHSDNKATPISKPLKGKIEKELNDWDKEFIFTHLIKDGVEKDHALLIECICAANFLNISDLLEVTCATVASMMRGKTPDEIRELFGIVNDITPEEEEEMKKENRWCY